jgi:hypothetical protein
MEFINLYTPADHTGPMEEVRKLVGPAYPEVMAKDKKAFWERKASVVKAHMLLLAHLERLDDAVPAALQVGVVGVCVREEGWGGGGDSQEQDMMPCRLLWAKGVGREERGFGNRAQAAARRHAT